MTLQTIPRALIATAIAAAGLLAVPVTAADVTTRFLAENQRAVEQLVTLGDQLKAVLTPDIGFPDENLEHWYAAVDAAFLPELLEADVLTTLKDRLDDASRDAAIAFYRSPLGQEMGELTSAFLGMTAEGEAERVTAAKNYLERSSLEHSGLLVQLFETQLGPRYSGDVMDVYFRAMKIAAEPVVGAAAASEWMDSAAYLKDGYVENSFLLMVSTFIQLPPDRLKELADSLGTPGMRSYAAQSTTAFIVALNGAVDRLEIEYAHRLAQER